MIPVHTNVPLDEANGVKSSEAGRGNEGGFVYQPYLRSLTPKAIDANTNASQTSRANCLRMILFLLTTWYITTEIAINASAMMANEIFSKIVNTNMKMRKLMKNITIDLLNKY